MKLTQSVATVGDLRRFLRLIDLAIAQGDPVHDDSELRARVGLGLGADGGPVKDLTVRVRQGPLPSNAPSVLADEGHWIDRLDPPPPGATGGSKN